MWGGTNTLAAALRSIEQQYRNTNRWQRIYERVTSKARVNIILDQDETYKDYIDPHWPDLNVNLNRDQFWSVAYFSFRYQDGNGPRRVPDELELYFKPDFMKLIKFGALLSSYPVLGDFADLGLPDIDEFLSEGDSPSYFELLDNGLRSWEDPTWGGWGGRSVKVKEHRWSDWPTYVLDPDLKYDTPRDQVDYDDPSRARDESPYPRQYDASYPQTRWIPALQRELAARAEWQTKTYEDANHPPVVGVADGKLDIDVHRGQRVALNGTVEDPDGDEVMTTWWHYREAGSYPGIADIARPSALNTSFVVPEDAKPGQTIHMILSVRDRAEKSFTRYQRIVATVKKHGGHPAQTWADDAAAYLKAIGVRGLKAGYERAVTVPRAGRYTEEVLVKGRVAARGAVTFRAPGERTVAVERTAAGRRLLRGRRHVSAVVRVTFGKVVQHRTVELQLG